MSEPYLVVQVAPQTQKMNRWQEAMFHHAGITMADVRVVNLIGEEPDGSNDRPTVAQIRNNAPRFKEEMLASKPRVIIPMGPEPFRAVSGLHGDKWAIDDARGYVYTTDMLRPVPTSEMQVIGQYKTNNKVKGYKVGDPRYGRVTVLRPGPIPAGFNGVIIPTFGSRFMQKMGLKPSFAMRVDLERARHYVQHGSLDMTEMTRYSSSINEFVGWDPDGTLAFDIETPMDSRVVERISFSDGQETFSVEWNPIVRAHAAKLLGRQGRIVVAHNAMFDVPRLRDAGCEVLGVVFDTMLAGRLIQPDLPKGLGKMVSLYLNATPWKGLAEFDPVFYSAKDSYMTYWLYDRLVLMLQQLGMYDLFMNNIMPAVPTLLEMHEEGITVDVVRGKVWLEKLEVELREAMSHWARLGLAGVKPLSPPQVKKLFYNTWGLKVQRNKEDGITTDELALANLTALYPSKKEVFDTLREIRRVDKLIETYAKNPMDENHRIHPSYLPDSKDRETADGKKRKGAASTGRLGVFRPNIQNQPPPARIIYIADRPGMKLREYDYSQAELRTIAAVSGDKVLMEALKGDVHQHLADKLGIERKLAKNTIYGSSYLAGPQTVSDMLKKDGVFVPISVIKSVQMGLADTFKEMWAWQDFIGNKGRAEGYLVNPFGRVRMFYGGNRDRAEMVDYIPQSTVADIAWIVLPSVAAIARKWDGRLITHVHDSFLFQFPDDVSPEADREIRQSLERTFDNVAPGFFLPVDAKEGLNWGEMEKFHVQAA